MKIKLVKVSIIVLLMLSISYSVLLYLKNDRYERFLSEEIANHVSLLSTSIYENHDLLLNAIESENMKTLDIEILISNYRNISIRSQALIEMGHQLNRLNPNMKNVFPSKNRSYHDELADLFKDVDGGNKETIYLTSTQLDKLKRLYRLEVEWKAIIDSVLKVGPVSDGMNAIHYGMPEGYWDTYLSNGITDDYWVDLIERLTETI